MPYRILSALVETTCKRPEGCGAYLQGWEDDERTHDVAPNSLAVSGNPTACRGGASSPRTLQEVSSGAGICAIADYALGNAATGLGTMSTYIGIGLTVLLSIGLGMLAHRSMPKWEERARAEEAAAFSGGLGAAQGVSPR